MGLVFLIVVVGALLLVRWATSYDPADEEAVVRVGAPEEARAAGTELTVVTWNIGFAGLGAEADFKPDGGRRLRAESRETVERHLGAIVPRLAAFDADVLLVQELARDCFLTRGVDVLAGVRAGLPGYGSAFTPTVRIESLPVLGRLHTGKGTFTPRLVKADVRHALPTANDAPGIVIQHYNALETILPAADGPDWSLFNLHLAAFDDGSLRREQLDRVLELLQAAHAAGRRVIAGGDWNLLLADTPFPATADQKHRFWIRPLPDDLDLPGWTWAADPSVATCRTLEQPYVEGVNHRCVIDGFLVGPGVEVLSVEGVDLGFADSDHQPVVLRVRG